jgi:hypothetical protein
MMLQLPEFAGMEDWYLPRYLMTAEERRAIEAVDALVGVFGFETMREKVLIQPWPSKQWSYGLDTPDKEDRLYYLAWWPLGYASFGNTVIESMSWMVSCFFVTDIRGAIAMPSWSPRLVDAGLTIHSHIEFRGGYYGST